MLIVKLVLQLKLNRTFISIEIAIKAHKSVPVYVNKDRRESGDKMALSRICFLIILCWHTTSGLYFAKTNYKTRETHNDAKQHLFNNLLRRHLKNGLYGSMENVLHSRSSDDCKGLPAAITEAINYNYEEAKDQITRKEFAMQAKMITGIDPFNATQVYDLACRLASKCKLYYVGGGGVGSWG